MLIISISANKSTLKQGPDAQNLEQQIKGTDSPSVLILRAVRTRANRVALNMTVPSLLRGMFIATRRCRTMQRRFSIRKITKSDIFTWDDFYSSPWSVFPHIQETHLTGHPVRAKLAKAQWGLDPPQQGHHVEVLYSTPDDHRHWNQRQRDRCSQKTHRDLMCSFAVGQTFSSTAPSFRHSLGFRVVFRPNPFKLI